MDAHSKKTIQKIIAISIITFLLEYLLMSIIGIFYRIILSFYAIKYLKQKNYMAIKTILIMMFLPLLWGCILILKGYLC